jgi:CTP synthase
VHLTLVPFISAAGEVKTKPTQHSVKELTGLGIQPDILLCRTDRTLEPKIKAKIAHFCNVDENAVITARDVDCIYEVPVVLHDEGLDERLVEKLNMWTGAPNLARGRRSCRWRRPRDEASHRGGRRSTSTSPFLQSLNKRWRTAASPPMPRRPHLRRFKDRFRRTAQPLTAPMPCWCRWASARAARPQIAAVRYAREEKVPFFGICFGMQMAVIEYARSVCGLADASSERRSTSARHPVSI